MPPDISYARKLKSEDLKWMKEYCGKTPFIVKGILSSHDANLAIKNGVDVIWVSNHGARATETDRGSIECLPEIVAAVNGRVPIIIDSGFRRGTDIYKALAMGADAIGIGRPYIWGLGAFGQAGVERVLDLLNRELQITMQGSGTPTVHSIGPDYILDAGRRVPRGRLGRELL